MQKKPAMERSLDLNRTQALYLTLFILTVSILIRLPDLTRPISKHHEFNAAIVLIGAGSWQQAGGAANFHYVPLQNFQHPGDRQPEKGVWVDNKGNELYLSLGPGWYIIPYAFFQALHLPATPLYLRILSLLIYGITTLLCFLFFEQLIPAGTDNRYFRLFTATTLFIFSPGLLWYLGNGYAHTSAGLPFLILMLICLLPMLSSPGDIRGSRLLLLALSVILSVYMDWFMLFVCISTGILALFLAGKNIRYLRLALTLFIGLSIGIALIFWQFASYAGPGAVAEYWKLRFFERSFTNQNDSFSVSLLSISGHFITAYGPILFFLLACIGIRKIKKLPFEFSPKETRFTLLYSAALLLNFLVLTDWASKHEYSVVPAGILLAWLAARLLPVDSRLLPVSTVSARLLPSAGYKIAAALIGLFLIFSTAQYYFINRPGPISQTGMPYNTYEVFGRHLQHTPPEYKIFARLPEKCPMIEYYAGRNLTLAQDSSAAKELMRKWHIEKAIWVKSKDFQYEGTTIISASK